MFLHPELLWGLAALAWPLILWLLFRRPRQTVPWAAVGLLERARRHTARRRQARSWLLLLLRLLALTALVAAAGVPLLRQRVSAWLGGEELPIVLVLDSSASMRTVEDQHSRFDRARAEARRVVEDLASGAPVSVLVVGPRTEWLSRRLGDHPEILRRLEELEPGFGASDWKAVSPALSEVRGASRIIGWTDTGGARAAARLPGSWRVIGEPIANAAVAALDVRPGEASDTLDVVASVRFFGETSRRGFRLWMDGREQAHGDVEPRDGSVVTIGWTLPRPLDRPVPIRFELDPDELTADDAAEALLPVLERVRVRLIAPEGQPVHLETAVRTLVELGVDPPIVDERHRLSEPPPVVVSDREVWALAGITRLAPEWAEALRTARSAGVGFVWFLGAELDSSQRELVHEITGVRPVRYLTGEPESPLVAEVVAPDSRWLRDWLRREPRALTIGARSGWELRGDEAGTILMRSRSGEALAWARERCFVSGLGLRPEESDLALGRGGDAPLLPLLQSVLAELAGARGKTIAVDCGRPLPGGPDNWTDLGGALAPEDAHRRRPGLYHEVGEPMSTCRSSIPLGESDTAIDAGGVSEGREPVDAPRYSLSTTCLLIAALLLIFELLLATALSRPGGRR